MLRRSFQSSNMWHYCTAVKTEAHTDQAHNEQITESVTVKKLIVSENHCDEAFIVSFKCHAEHNRM